MPLIFFCSLSCYKIYKENLVCTKGSFCFLLQCCSVVTFTVKRVKILSIISLFFNHINYPISIQASRINMSLKWLVFLLKWFRSSVSFEVWNILRHFARLVFNHELQIYQRCIFFLFSLLFDTTWVWCSRPG